MSARRHTHVRRSNQRGTDRDRISTTEPHEVAYWTKALGITKEELVAAVKVVGHMAADVRAHLAKQKKR